MFCAPCIAIQLCSIDQRNVKIFKLMLLFQFLKSSTCLELRNACKNCLSDDECMEVRNLWKMSRIELKHKIEKCEFR